METIISYKTRVIFMFASGRAHLREAVLRHEESQRLHRMCRELRGKNALLAELRRVHRRANEAYKLLEEDDDFRDILDPPLIVGKKIRFMATLHISDYAWLGN
jgi:hypothetical protein